VNVLLCSTYELGHQPLGLASPAAALRSAGIPVECRDLAVEPLAEASVRNADVVGISVPMHTAIRLGALLAAEVKAIRPSAHVCFYGLYASLNGDYLLANGGDSVVGGEYELGLVSLVRRLSGVPGDEHPGVRLAGGPAVLPFLGRLRFPVPDRGGLPPLDRYAFLDLGDERRTVGYVEASRGCAHQCLHCPIPPVYGGRVRIVQEDVVLDDVAQLVAMGARHIDFGDPDFLNGVRHSLRIVRRLHERFPELTFNFTAKVEHLIEHEDVVREMAGLGCLFIQSAVESLSDTVLRHLDKGHTEADVRGALSIAAAAGIVLRPTFVAFTPWTTLDDYLFMLDFVEDVGWIDNVPPVQYTIRLLVPPGSSLLGRPETERLLGPLDEAQFTYRWRHPDPRMDALHEAASALVEQAETAGEDPRLTFYRLKSLAGSVARGRGAAFGSPSSSPVIASSVPRLSEPWFC
jgi:radical SAM superfamily enzyme YgiQ (UPF0313 family)